MRARAGAMRTPLVFAACLFLALPVAPTHAQEPWSPDVYTALITRGRELHAEAMAAEAGSEIRRDLLVESLSANRQAQYMLRGAVVAGQVDAYRADAITELFNLSDNVIVELVALEQCEAAAVELSRLATDQALLPPDAGPHLETLRGRVATCREQLASGPAPWNEAAYEVERDEAEAWRQRAAAAATEAERNTALYEATVAESAALGRLRGAIEGGVPVPGVEAGRQLGVHYNRVIAGLLEMGLCEAGAARVAERDAALAELGGGAAMSGYGDELARCRDLVAESETGAETGLRDPVVTTPPPTVERDTNPWPWLLIGVGGSAAIAALVVDLSLAGDRGDFDDLQADCDSGAACNFEALSLLGDSIDRQKIIIGVLAGVAVAAGATGIVWLVLDDDDEEDAGRGATVDVAPILGPDVFGASVRVFH